MKKKKEINFLSRVSTFMLELSGETLMRINLKNRVFLVICCLKYPHAVPFLKNKIPYFSLATFKTTYRLEGWVTFQMH